MSRRRIRPIRSSASWPRATSCWPAAPNSTRCVAISRSPSRRGIGGSRSTAALKANDAKRLKELEIENSRLKRLLADAELDKAMLKELAEGNF